ncbi:MAG: DUF4838 domain-containing protein [Rhodospirillales bacterium]|jgi:hypothetical protein|nr:DUF4838 domain-containing protein [Rhodospirillales bacterium]
MKSSPIPALAAAILLTAGTAGAAGGLTLAERGRVRCVVVAPGDWTNTVAVSKGLPKQAEQLLQSRRKLFQESVRDLAHYLGRMSRGEVPVVTAPPEDKDVIPVRVGAAAGAVFGPVGISKSGLFGFRIVADARRGIGLYGESEVGSSYAIYELLHRLGCRWYMPGELGEVVPVAGSLMVPEMDEKLAPATDARIFWQGGADFLRRNRMGRHDNTIWLAYGDGSFERFFSKADLEAHPEWRALRADGTPHPWALRPTHPEVAAFVADKILAQLDSVYEPMRKLGLRPGYSLTPGDGQVPTEDPLERPHDPEPRVWEGAAGRWSVTDRCILMITRIAEQVRKRYPDVAFGDQAYVNKSLPPARYPVPSDFRVVICPIDFNRFHPMNWPNHVNEDWLLKLVQGWNQAGAAIGAYWYGINLAEISAPCPFIAKWGADVALLLENGMTEWMPETMNGWDSMMPGYYLSLRMAFHAHEKPDEILADLWTRFYGAAAASMERYWTGIDQAYLAANEFAGSPYGYLKIFTPEVMAAARADLNAALSHCRTPIEYRRVKLIDESFTLFELYMKMRQDWASGRLARLQADYESWRGGVLDMVRRYRDPADATYVQGRHGNPAWSDSMYSRGYLDGARMEKEYARHSQPMLEWKWQHNPAEEAASLAWTDPAFDDQAWPVTHVVRDTWSSLGHHFTLTDRAAGKSGRMVYRASQRLRKLPEGKQAYLWIGATDGSVKLFVNGRHIPYVDPVKGNTQDTFNGYCKSASFNVTDALLDGGNQFTILAERNALNELGTGGLMGPVIVYRDR